MSEPISEERLNALRKEAQYIGGSLLDATDEIDRLREQARGDEEAMRAACRVCTCNELCNCSEPMLAILSTRLAARSKP